MLGPQTLQVWFPSTAEGVCGPQTEQNKQKSQFSRQRVFYHKGKDPKPGNVGTLGLAQAAPITYSSLFPNSLLLPREVSSLICSQQHRDGVPVWRHAGMT